MRVSRTAALLAGSAAFAMTLAACGPLGSRETSAVGELALRLVDTSASGVTYRLRHAVLHITGTSTATLSSESDPDATTLTKELPAGTYLAELRAGWHLERQMNEGSFEAVKAVLTSPNPAPFEVVDQETTALRLRFRAGDDVLEFGAGRVVIGIEVEDDADAGQIDGGSVDGGDGGGCSFGTWREVATIPNTPVQPRFIEAIHALYSDPNTLLIATQNEGSDCGYGTPAAIWRVQLDPQTRVSSSVSFVQYLDLVQEARRVLFESSDGTLFTGSGWCGSKPPYYSVDHGVTFLPATSGEYPQESSFAYGEFDGNVYVGTGYSFAALYRWLSAGRWARVFDVPRPHNMATAIVPHQGQLFVSALLYADSGGCERAAPVYVSKDGSNFAPTSGFPPCYSVTAMASSGSKLLAIGQAGLWGAGAEYIVYEWNSETQSWVVRSPFPLDNPWKRLYAHGSVFYGVGKAPESSTEGIYRFVDELGSWELVRLSDERILSSSLEGDTIYIGSAGSQAGAKIYALDVCGD